MPQNLKKPKPSNLKPQNKTLNQQKTSKHKSKNLKTPNLHKSKTPISPPKFQKPKNTQNLKYPNPKTPNLSKVQNPKSLNQKNHKILIPPKPDSLNLKTPKYSGNNPKTRFCLFSLKLHPNSLKTWENVF